MVSLPPDNYGNVQQVIKLREGFSTEDIKFPPLGYEQVALESYQVFLELREQGAIAGKCKFQVCLPTPLAPIQFYVHPEDRAAIEPAYEKKLLQELINICNGIPSIDLAIQWDTAVEFALLEEVFPTFLTDIRADILERLIRLGDAVPADIELGYHLCYGDSGHQHFIEPEDTAKLVDVANGISAGLNRPLNWIHLPVPKERSDTDYFVPLKNLNLHETTELYLGLVHFSDGAEGAKQRVKAARKIKQHFGIATECGFGRRPPETVEPLMQIHRDILDQP